MDLLAIQTEIDARSLLAHAIPACPRPLSQTRSRPVAHESGGSSLRLDGIPVFRPTMEEFRDFEHFVRDIEPWLRAYGGVKVSAPTEWTEELCSRRITTCEGERTFTNYKLSQRAGRQTLPDGILLLQGLNKPGTSVSLERMMSRAKEARKMEMKDALLVSELSQKAWRLAQAGGREYSYGETPPLSLFPHDFGPWNLGNLPDLLKELEHFREDKYLYGGDGISSPWVYFGTMGSVFTCHQEDMNYYSINYQHEGASKEWHFIVPDDAAAFEDLVNRVYHPANYRKCPEHIRHKDYMFDIDHLRRYGIRVNTVAQSPGDFIITHPRGYHQGINLGDNINEAVNFCTPDWIEYGRTAGFCRCDVLRGSLQFDPEDIIRDIQRMRKKRSVSELSLVESATGCKRVRR